MNTSSSADDATSSAKDGGPLGSVSTEGYCFLREGGEGRGGGTFTLKLLMVIESQQRLGCSRNEPPPPLRSMTRLGFSQREEVSGYLLRKYQREQERLLITRLCLDLQYTWSNWDTLVNTNIKYSSPLY